MGKQPDGVRLSRRTFLRCAGVAAGTFVTTSFYDSGYDWLDALQLGFENAGGAIASTKVTHLPTLVETQAPLYLREVHGGTILHNAVITKLPAVPMSDERTKALRASQLSGWSNAYPYV